MSIIRVVILVVAAMVISQRLRPAESPLSNPVFWLAFGYYFAGLIVGRYFL